MRKCHILKENKGSEIPSLLMFLDTETDSVAQPGGGYRHVLRFGWAAFRSRLPGGAWSTLEYRRFETPKQFIEFLVGKTRPKTKLYLFAHNCSFDLPIVDIFRLLPRRGFRLHKAVIECPPVMLTWRSDGGTIIALDTLNWWRAPLATLGAALGVPKMAMPERDAPPGEWDAYCRRDVAILAAQVTNWLDLIRKDDLGGFAGTIAGQAMRLFRHRYLTVPIYIHDCERALKLERESYVGGRCECFYLGKVSKPMLKLDVNSMYPFVMRENLFPFRLRWARDVSASYRIGPDLEHHLMIARVSLRTDSPDYGVHRGGRLIFPVGEFEACLTTPELRAAHAAGHIQRVWSAACYDGAPLFHDFVVDMYARRQRYIAADAKIQAGGVKLLMNSLYGKFGQRGMVWEETGNADPDRACHWEIYDADSHRLVQYRAFGGITQVKEIEGESRDSFPAIAAHVTAYARRQLLSCIKSCGRRGVYYCDTDSLFVAATTRLSLAGQISQERLGALKIEAEADTAEFRGAKDYTFGKVSRTKGVRKDAVELLPGFYVQARWTSLIGELRGGQVSAPETLPQFKAFRREYKKGNPGPDGWVRPLELHEPITRA